MALTTNVAASIASAQPGLAATTITPASAGPSTDVSSALSPIRALAC